MNTTLLVCDTCGYDAANPDAVRPGKRLADQLEQALTERQGQSASPELAIRLERFSCLMACKRYCTVQIRHPHKIGYQLGDMHPDTDSTQAILDYTSLYTVSDTGQVPYRQWPEQVKGKFIARFPVLENTRNPT